MWIIYFEDADKLPEVYMSEEAARERCGQLIDRWDIHLFKEVKI